VGASAELMLGLRVRDITRADIRAALAERRTLVKTVGLRGTLHLLPAAEIPEWMAAMRLRFPAEERRLARAGIGTEELRSVTEAISEIVGPEPMTRPDFERRLAARAGGWALTTNEGWLGSYKNWPMALGWPAALGRVCYGPAEGGRITLVRLSGWCEWREVDAMEGGAFAVRRFLRAYGPSTQAEFSRWFALDPAITRRLFAQLADELAEVDVEGSRRWALRSDLRQPAEAAPDAVNLLPHFDVFTVGSHPRDQLMDARSDVARVSPGTAAPLAVLLIGGRVSGVWERRPQGKRLVVRVDANRSLNRGQRASVEAQAQRVAAILERECELEFGPVEIRPHL
jgi:winged helix DNA-binding protein